MKACLSHLKDNLLRDMKLKIEWLFVFVLFMFVVACNGQHKSVDQKDSKIKSDIKKENTFSILKDQDQKINRVVRTIFQDSKGVMWFGTESGAFKLVGDSLTYLSDILCEYGKRVTIKAITEDKEGRIWLGHTGGVSRVQSDQVKNFYISDGLISDDVWHIAADQSGKIWIGTIDGLCFFDGSVFTKFDLPKGERDFSLGVSSAEMVHQIFVDSSGRLWFSTNAGLFSYAAESLIHVSKTMGINTTFVNEVFEASDRTIYVSTKDGLYHLKAGKAENITDGKLEKGKGIGSIAEDRAGRIWFVSNQHFLYTYDQGEIIEFEKSEVNKGPVVFKIYKDQEQRLWFVGFGGAYRLEDGNFVHVSKYGPW